MSVLESKRPLWLGTMALVAVLFGLLTLGSGGAVLFEAQARQVAGDYVPFVVWFNFLAGFAYVIAGVGLWLRQRWAVWLSFLIAGVTLLTFAIFGVYVLRGGTYELRTVAAMSLRTVVWFIISGVAYRHLKVKFGVGV